MVNTGLYLEFGKLIADCARSNDENERVNLELESELETLRQNLKAME